MNLKFQFCSYSHDPLNHKKNVNLKILGYYAWHVTKQDINTFGENGTTLDRKRHGKYSAFFIFSYTL